MFSYLRSHHRRTGSNPSSPEPPPLPPPPKDLADASAPSIPSPDFFAYRHFGDDGPAHAQYALGARGDDSGSIQSPISNSDATPVSPFPPVLPPITRVTSVRGRRRATSPEKGRPERLSEEREYTRQGRAPGHVKRKSEESVTSQDWREDLRSAAIQEQPGQQQEQLRMFQGMDRPKVSRRPHTSQGPTGFRSRGQSVQANSSAASGFRAFSSTTSPVQEHAPAFPPPSDYASQPRPPISSHAGSALASSSFYSISYDDARSNTPPIKHNAPAKPPTPPPPIMPNQKSKPKLNLRNPMSLLLRRRESHSLDPLQLGDEATLLGLHRSTLPDDYDPRIIGKGVHDFSAPRPPPRKVFTTPNIHATDAGALRPPSADDSSGERGRSQSPYRHKRAHTPTFVEHFDEDVPTTEKNVRAEELANKDFVTRNASSPLDQDKALPLPPFAKRASGQFPVLGVVPESTVSPSEEQEDAKETAGTLAVPALDGPSRTPPGPPRLTPNKEAKDPMGSITATPENMIKAAKPAPAGPTSLAPTSPPKPRSRKSAFGLPAHLDSSASRFSFQWGGPDSHLQEKLLEERHKAKQAQAAMASKMRQDEEDWVEDDDAYDDMDDDNYDDDGFDDGFSMPDGLGAGLSNSMLASSTLDPPKMKEDNPLGAQDIIEAQRMALRSNPPSPADYSPASLDSRSLRAPSITSGRPSVDVRPSFERKGSSLSVSRSAEREGRNDSPAERANGELDAPRLDVSLDQSGTRSSPLAAASAQALDDDLYFDDGLIEDPGDEDDTAHFDESQFDDPSHHLYERRPVSKNIQSQQQYGMTQSQRASIEKMSDRPEQQRVTSLESNARPFSGFSEQYGGEPSRKSHMSDFDNLDAYHGALATAAAQAFAAGRFERKNSVDVHGNVVSTDQDGQRRSVDSSLASDADRSSKPSALDSSAQSSGLDENRSSQSTAFSPTQPRASTSDDHDSASPKNQFSPFNGLRIDSTGLGFEFEPESYTFGVDCDFDGIDENDPMIAAANAEALANDDEGEYGREFGFYAAPPPSAGLPNGTYLRSLEDVVADSSDDGSDAGYSIGGYFGPKGIDVIGRQKSLREPNLTPITERSEYSTRNSCISLFGLPSSADLTRQGLTPISPIPPGSSGPIPSPGLAQLARMSPYGWEEDEMSLEKLMKLRRGAWGEGGARNSVSDAGSVASGGSPRNSSPVAPHGAGHALPKTHLQPVSPNSPGAAAPATGWLNGVGVGFDSAEGLARLGEDDESSSDEDVEGEQDSDYDTDGVLDDRVYDDEDSPMPDSPTITAADSASVRGSSPIASQLPEFPSVDQMQAQYQRQFTHLPNAPFFAAPNIHPPSPPNAAFDPQTPMSPSSTASPTTAMRTAANLNKSLPQLPSSPSPMPRPNPSMPHSPAHSRNNSANEGVTVTYVKEKDDSVEGGVRWVLERRRTELSGEVTVLGREVITGGRI